MKKISVVKLNPGLARTYYTRAANAPAYSVSILIGTVNNFIEQALCIY
jgi:hypothetical protein